MIVSGTTNSRQLANGETNIGRQRNIVLKLILNLLGLLLLTKVTPGLLQIYIYALDPFYARYLRVSFRPIYKLLFPCLGRRK